MKCKEAVFAFATLILVCLIAPWWYWGDGVHKLGSRGPLVFLNTVWLWYISLLPLSPSLLGKCCSYVQFSRFPWWEVLQGQTIWWLTVTFTADMAVNIITSHLLQMSSSLLVCTGLLWGQRSSGSLLLPCLLSEQYIFRGLPFSSWCP